MTNQTTKSSVPPKRMAWTLIVTGAIGSFASLMLSIEEYLHLKNPGQALSCDINPLIGCGNILDTWQGHVLFGIPNQFFGLIAFAVLMTLGVVLLTGARLPRWIWQGLQLGALGGIITVGWFMYQSLFVLNHLCPYCMITWIVTLIVSWYITMHNLHSGTWQLPARFERASAFVQRHHLDILVTIFVVLVLSIVVRFRDFFFS